MSVMERLGRLISEPVKRPAPLAFYPARRLTGASMEEIVSDSEAAAACLEAVEARYRPSLLVRMTELWVEAEAFGAQVRISETGFPVILRRPAPETMDFYALPTPDPGAGRLGVFTDAVRLARAALPDALLFAGVTGPFSLCGCLTDAQELMMECYADPGALHEMLERVTDFLIAYAGQYRLAGASGIFLAEPSACMLSPEMAREFSHRYAEKMIRALQGEDFAVVYHTCGDVTPQLGDLARLPAAGWHFGDAVSLPRVLERFPADRPVLGNVHPAKFSGADRQKLRNEIGALRELEKRRPNLILSSGCDLSPAVEIGALDLLFDE